MNDLLISVCVLVSEWFVKLLKSYLVFVYECCGIIRIGKNIFKMDLLVVCLKMFGKEKNVINIKWYIK